VDSCQDAEAAGRRDELEALGVRLAERAPQLGFEPLRAAGASICEACRSGDSEAARKAVLELTELAQRVRRGHRSAAS
jgi:DNA-binding FadR family transcriptional regulator